MTGPPTEMTGPLKVLDGRAPPQMSFIHIKVFDAIDVIFFLTNDGDSFIYDSCLLANNVSGNLSLQTVVHFFSLAF